MARSLPKFPLEMANGTKVRNIEDLRANADIDSIVTYFLDGRLARWCRAFGYDTFPEKFEGITFELIKNIYDTLEIPANEQEIKGYIKENGLHASATTDSFNNKKSESGNENELDYTNLKMKLAHLENADKLLQNCIITISLNLDENGNTGSYRVEIEEKEMQQYMSFVSPYKADKKNDSLEQLYQNIAFTVENLSLRADRVKENHVISFSTVNFTEINCLHEKNFLNESINNENKNCNENTFLITDLIKDFITDEKGRMDTMSNEAMKNIVLDTIEQCFGMTDSRQPQQVKSDVDTIRQALSTNDEIKEILSTVNDAVASTLNDGSVVVNLTDLKAFLNQAIPAWQNAMKNQIAFQQQHYQFPPRT